MKPYFETELGHLFNCNCVDYMKTVPDNTFDLAITSPPYDNLRDYKGYEFDFESIAKELYRITKQGGVVVWVVGDATINGSETGTSFRQALYFMKCGFNLHDTMIWQKPGFSAIGALATRYAPVFEYMFVFVKNKLKTFNPLKDKKVLNPNSTLSGTIRNKDGTTKRMSGEGKKYGINGLGQRYNVWIVNSQTQEGHPAPFPESLAYDHIVSWSNEKDLVFDPMIGSGTTAKMCEKLNRKWIGCEIAEEYCEIAKRRIKAEADQLKIGL